MRKLIHKYRDEIYAGCAALFVFAILCVVAMLHGCGGGAGSATISPGVPSPSNNITLHASRIVETAGNSLSLYASVYDGNGRPVEGATVNFAVTAGEAMLSSPSAKTDSRGIASVSIKTASPSVVVVKASTVDASAVRTLYFVSSYNPSATLTLSADSDGDGIYNEQGDFTLTADGRTRVFLKATFLNVAGEPEGGRTVIFGADKSDVSFSDTSVITDSSGNAYTTFTARSKGNVVTVYAYETVTGAADIISFTLNPVTVGSVEVRPDSNTVEAGKTVGVKTCVFDTSGYPMPDDTYIRYSLSPSDAGNIDLFGYTTQGCHNSTFQALKAGSVKITATASGKSGSATITITEPVKPLLIIPSSAVVAINTPYTFTVSGGVKPYTATVNSVNATLQWNDDSHFSVSSSVAETVTITVYDSEGKTATAQLTVQ